MHNEEDGRKRKEIYNQLEIVPLRVLLKILRKRQASLENLRDALSCFQCTKNLDEQDFIRTKAIDFENRNKARTYLIVLDAEIVAYFSLAFKSIDLQNVSKSKIKDMTAGENVESYSSYLIGHIAKKDCCSIQLMDFILDKAFDIITTAQRYVGGRLTYVDCKDEPKLIKMYEENHFKYFKTSEKTGLKQFYRKV